MAHTTVRSHIDHMTGETKVEVDSPNPDPSHPVKVVRWRHRTVVDLKKPILKQIEDATEANASALAAAAVPLDQWTAKLHLARDAEASRADAEARRRAEEDRIAKALAEEERKTQEAEVQRAVVQAETARLADEAKKADEALTAKRAELAAVQAAIDAAKGSGGGGGGGGGGGKGGG